MKRVMLLLALSNAVLFAVISCKNEQTAIADKETATTECYSGGNAIATSPPASTSTARQVWAAPSPATRATMPAAA